MIISHQRRFVMLAPWKTASSTAHHRLRPYNESPYSRFYHYNPYLQRVVHQHLTYAEYQCLPESRLGYYTGAFVRNPYDRVYSGFLQLQRDLEAQPGSDFPAPWIRSLVLRQLAENRAQLAAAAFEFDGWWRLVEEHQIYDIGRNSSFPLHPAFFWTGLGGRRNVDFVGRVESFEQDFASFCAQAGLDPPEAASVNVTGAPPATGEDAAPRHLGRMSAYSISKINALFANAFELFGYRVHRG